MDRTLVGSALLIGAVGLLCGCTAIPAQPVAAAVSQQASAAEDQQHAVSDVDAALTPQLSFHGDSIVNLNDDKALFAFASAVVSGQIVDVESSSVSGNGDIVTTYRVRIDEVYKGKLPGEEVLISLPGGTMTLGAYIPRIEEVGFYERRLGYKTTSVTGVEWVDPHTLDPATPITENWGMNPASASTLAELKPDAWLFYLGGANGNVYFGVAMQPSLAYIRNGTVHALNPEAERESFSLRDLS